MDLLVGGGGSAFSPGSFWCVCFIYILFDSIENGFCGGECRVSFEGSTFGMSYFRWSIVLTFRCFVLRRYNDTYSAFIPWKSIHHAV